jgi:hypothetical protein
MQRVTASTWYQVTILQRDGSMKLKEYRTEKAAQQALARANRVSI